MVNRVAGIGGSDKVPHLSVVPGVTRGVEETEGMARLVSAIQALIEDYAAECLSRDSSKIPASKTPKPRLVDGGERFLYAGQTPEVIDYLGRLRIGRIPCLEEIHPGRKLVHAVSKKTTAGDTMAIFSRYPVGVDAWERPRRELGVYKMRTINLCDMFGIPHTQADFERARENGRQGYDVLVRGLGHFAVLLPRGKQNSLNLAPLSEYPEDVFFALNRKINTLLKERPEYAKISNGNLNGIPQFGDNDLARILGR